MYTALRASFLTACHLHKYEFNKASNSTVSL